MSNESMTTAASAADAISAQLGRVASCTARALKGLGEHDAPPESTAAALQSAFDALEDAANRLEDALAG